MKAMRLVEFGKALQPDDIEAPEPGAKGVVVKVESAGVCHTDVHLIAGGYGLGEGKMLNMKDRGINLPITPGHEIAGSVVGIDSWPEETSLRDGDRVVVFPWLGCGTCRKCVSGRENLCEVKPYSLGIFRDGGYAEYVLVPHARYLIPIESLDPAQAAPLACSGLTAYSALKKCKLMSDDLLVIIGAGGLGTTAIQLAKKLSAARVMVLDIADQKLELAAELGADHTVNTSGLERRTIVSKVRELNSGRGADGVIDFVGNQSTSTTGFDLLAKEGRLVLVGLFGGAASFPLPFFPLKGAEVLGNYTGTLRDLGELVQLANRSVIKPVTSSGYRLEDANAVLERLGRGEVKGRAILQP